MTRRDWLRQSSFAALALSLSAPQLAAAPKRKRLLVYTRSQGFQHDVVKVVKDHPSIVDSVWTLLGSKHGFDVECTKDGRVFVPEMLAKFDAFFFMTTGDLTNEKSEDGSPPMPKEGKKALLDAIAGGKGFIGSHCASDTFHSPGKADENQSAATMDPYIAMLGGEFISHGDQQNATMQVADARFPGMPAASDFTLLEEWYSLKNFSPDLHVILVNETSRMRNWQYERAAFPATWARMHGRGRVFYTSMGHRDDMWTNPLFQEVMTGAFKWVTGQAEADLTPNMSVVTPQAMTLPKEPPPKPKKEDKKEEKKN
jgi:type 1 glutamine amidotransferase